MKKTITDEQLTALPDRVRPYLTRKRFEHTAAVVREVRRMGAIFLPGEENRLMVAGWLHDITKREDGEDQLKLCREFGIMDGLNGTVSPKVLHSLTGAAVAGRDFPDLTDDEILSAVRWHTTGHAGMTLFEAVLYLADYIEDTRTFDGCVALRKFFWDRIDAGSEPEKTLNETMIISFDRTIEGLIGRGDPIDEHTIAARNDYLKRRDKNLTD